MTTTQEIIIPSRQGNIKGLVKQDMNGRDYFSFNGIPFAEPPIGELRFKPPVPAKSWGNEIWDATYCRDDAFQQEWMGEFNVYGSEDCLYLSVYSPNIKPKNLLPVMFWCHGGAFLAGSSYPKQAGPEFLMSKDVVVVSTAYRLNVFGFLNLNDSDSGVTGNQGLKDQVEALRWVQSSIKYFGGDPSNVTIFGESAGGASIQYHMISPLTKGLFHKAIAQSGDTLNPWASAPYDLPLAKQMGCDASSSKEQLEFLQKQSTEDLFLAANKYYEDKCKTEKHYTGDIFGACLPTIEKNYPGAYLSEHPKEILKRGDFHKVPLIAGFTKDEGYVFLKPFGKLAVPDERLTIRDLAKEVHYNEDKIRVLDDKIQKFYFGNMDPKSDDAILSRAEHKSDALMNYGIVQTSRFIASQQEAPLYFYQFSAVTDANLERAFDPEPDYSVLLPKSVFDQICNHGDDLTYLLTWEGVPKEAYSPNSLASRIRDIMITLWSNFAKFSDPTKSDENGILNGITWIPVNRAAVLENKDLNYLEISNNGLEMKLNPMNKRIRFWDTLYDYVESTKQ